MRIISGKYKGRNLLGYDINGTRPTMSRVKESLFASIQTFLPDSTILDLFSGSGNLGIEALSLNAKYAYLVDHNKKAYNTINKNIELLNIKNIKSLCLDYKNALLYFKDNNITFDVIFLDPPYKTDYINISIELITKYNLLNNNGIIVCESDSLDKIKYNDKYNLIKNKKYGDKYIAIIEKV